MVGVRGLLRAGEHNDVKSNQLLGCRKEPSAKVTKHFGQLTWKVHLLDEEIDTNGLLIVLRELIIGKPSTNRTFANSTIPENDYLELLGLDVFIIFHHDAAVL